MAHLSSLESGNTSKNKILVVDDHNVNQQLAMMMIERLGYKVDVVANGKEAVEACSTIPYALVFMDCQMPVMDGYEATKKIREAEKVKCEGNEETATVTSGLAPHCTPHVPIVAMTANEMPENREKCLQVGMDDYLAKPVRPEGLAQIFAKWLPTSCEKLEEIITDKEE